MPYRVLLDDDDDEEEHRLESGEDDGGDGGGGDDGGSGGDDGGGGGDGGDGGGDSGGGDNAGIDFGGGDSGSGGDSGDGGDDGFHRSFDTSPDDPHNQDGDNADNYAEQERRRQEDEQRRQDEERRRREEERRQEEERQRQLEEAYRQQQTELERQNREQQARLDQYGQQATPDQQGDQQPQVTDTYKFPGQQVPQPMQVEPPQPGEQRPPEYAWDTDDPNAWVAVRNRENKVDRWIRRTEFNPLLHEPVDEHLPSLGPPPVGTIAHPIRQDPSKPPVQAVQPNEPPKGLGLPSPLTLPDEYDPTFQPLPDIVTSPTPPRASQQAPQQAANAAADAAAQATAQAGGSTEDVANAAATAAVRALDGQTLSQQTAWTQQAFRSRYGAQAESAWIAEHNAERARNLRIYGAEEPNPGLLPIPGQQGPPAPDRRIGVTPPPAPGTASRYGINVAPTSATSAAGQPVINAQNAGSAAVRPPGSVQVPADAPPSVLPGNLPRLQNAGGGPGEPPARGAVPAASTYLPPYTPPAASRPAQNAGGGPGEPPARGALPVEPAPGPTAGEPGGPPLQPGPVLSTPGAPPAPITAAQAAAYERGGINPATGDIDVRATPAPSVEQPSDLIDLAAVKDDSVRWTTTRDKWDTTPAEVKAKWNVINARGVSTAPPIKEPTPPEGPLPKGVAVPTGEPVPERPFRDVPWLNLHEDEPAEGPLPKGVELPPYRLYPTGGAGAPIQEAPSSRDIQLAQQILEQGDYQPGQPLQPVDDKTAEAMFSPANLQAAIPSEGLSPYYPSQDTLKTPAKWAACGPVAILALAASRGISLTEQQAIDAARNAGWTPQRGMAGPASEVAALNAIGVPAEIGPVNDLGRIRASIQAGNPVVLSSPGEQGHYFVVENIDNQGRMDLGNTATVLAANPTKQRWFTLPEMRAKLGTYGAVDTAIYVKDPTKPQQAPGMTLLSNRPEAPPQAPQAPGPEDEYIRPPEDRDLSTETALASIDTDRPLGTILTMAGIHQDTPEAAQQAQEHVYAGMTQWLQGNQQAGWVEPYLNDVARLAYSQEERGNGRLTDLRAAPAEYINAWKDAFYGGDERAPMVAQLRHEIGLGGPHFQQIGLPREGLSRADGTPTAQGQPSQPLPSHTERPGATPNLPQIIRTGRPQPGLVSGQAAPVDQMATIWTSAMDQTGDKGFADGITALLIGEGGLTGGAGDKGLSRGPYQFYWGGGEGNGFERWLQGKMGRPVSRAEAQQLAHDVDLASEYYLPRAYEFYRKGIQTVPNNPVQAIAVGGHNSGAPRDPQVWRAYQNAWDNWNKGNIEQNDTVQSGSALAPQSENGQMNQMLRRSAGRVALNDQPPVDSDGLPPGNTSYPIYRPPTPVYDSEGIERTLAPSMSSPGPAERYSPGPLIGQRDTRVALMSPTARMGDIFSQADEGGLADTDAALAGPTSAQVFSSPRVQEWATGALYEDPWNPDPAAQENRHAGMQFFAHELTPEQRQQIFSESADRALEMENIPPEQREYWKRNMLAVVKGQGFPGENPQMNPFMMVGEQKGTPLYAAPPSDKSDASNEQNSSALGYYQFIINDPNDPSKDPYGHRAFIPKGGNFFDPVTQQRMFIRAVIGGKHHGDPASVVYEKRTSPTHTWGP